MITKAGCNIVRVSELSWEERVLYGNNKHRAKTYWHDQENDLTLSLVDQPLQAIEATHAHAGTQVATVLKGSARVSGLTLNPLDVILAPSDEPYGPLAYPDGCQLFSCFQGNNQTTEAHALATEKRYLLIQSEQMPWDAKAGGALHMKTLVASGAGRLMLTAMRLSASFTVPVGSRPHMQAALVVEGSAVIDGETLGTWDFMYMEAGIAHGPISFPTGATLLMVAMRPA